MHTEGGGDNKKEIKPPFSQTHLRHQHNTNSDDNDQYKSTKHKIDTRDISGGDHCVLERSGSVELKSKRREKGRSSRGLVREGLRERGSYGGVGVTAYPLNGEE